MCGILGEYSAEYRATRAPHFRACLNLMAHRGPDGSGIEEFDSPETSVTLGHRRLSIIDLTSGGQQPMNSSCGRYCIVYNGELYNYRELKAELSQIGIEFRTESDTEVLLAAWVAWGSESLKRLDGMFGFALLDRKTSSLTCVRDPFGIKPFYYSVENQRFCFASEVTPVRKLWGKPDQLNFQRIYDYLVWGVYDDTSSTFFSNILSLPPGHMLTVTSEAELCIDIQRWWFPSIEENTNLTFNQASEQLRHLFLESVKRQLRSDVKIGATLSGGIDSSAIVCAMKYIEPDLALNTFSFIAPGSEKNEEKWIDIVNNSVSAIPHKISINSSELAEDLIDMIKVQGEPFGSTSIYAHFKVQKLAAANGIKVTLDGQGADELLAGYNGYPASRILSLLEEKKYLKAFHFLNSWSEWPGRGRKMALMNLFSVLVPDRLDTVARASIGRSATPFWINKPNLIKNNVQPRHPTEGTRSNEAKTRRIAEELRSSLTGTGLTKLLRHADRNSMRWSVESRVPFLTTKIAEFTLSLPEEFLIAQSGETKSLFRHAIRDIVPNEVISRRDKIGFVTPEKKWLRELHGKVPDLVDSFERVPFLRPEECKKEVTQILEGTKPFSWLAWRMVNISVWLNSL